MSHNDCTEIGGETKMGTFATHPSTLDIGPCPQRTLLGRLEKNVNDWLEVGFSIRRQTAADKVNDIWTHNNRTQTKEQIKRYL